MTRSAALETSAIELWLTGVIRAGSQEITPAADCDELHVGDRLIGSYVAATRCCCQVRLHLRANLHRSSEPPTMSAEPSPEQVPSGNWELHTANMRPGGYTLTLQMVGLAIDDSNSPCCGSVAIDFQLAPRSLRVSAAPSPRPRPQELAWKLTAGHDPAGCR
ncbi:MAG: hypothetical protein R6X02_31550 [Enhygromyxa sp.]